MSEAATPFRGSAEIVDIAERRFGDTPLGAVGPLNSGGGGGRFDDMSWQEAVRRVDDKVDSNFKWVIGVFGGGFMALLVAFASGFLILSERVESGNEKIATKLEAISQQIGVVNTDVAVLKARAGKPK